MANAEQSAPPAPAQRKGLLLRAGVIGGLFLVSLLVSSFGRALFPSGEGDTQPAADKALDTAQPPVHGRSPALEPAAD